ncbi:HAMP domain protein [[Clostridium] bifermentans ATCC 638]|uniref:HAMP domain protein n=1 Tax=Paraclostridium bifermentans ATCC 638 = DSM 14991 TaxID=1233171 RepID=T4VML8_PARBF|nr:histidine kinase [Paraclostridium bifermentans]EQK41917.1 HAMP domain protein [[Clostridium] bifermentans ATCC 638] [Paraclostridium bifermentans ATCC 638 = DSM 14991]RIZ59237.1 sensor histidine kinase [Paraclostridium bifermentans]UAG18793.1 histidine kinase [Paraclostridium bifermentans]
MKKLYNLYTSKNLFSKMLLIYSAITIVSICLLSNIFLKYYLESELQNELNIHSEMIFNIEKRFEEQDIVSTSLINGINTQKKITDEIQMLINSTYEDYISYKLDKFSRTNVKEADLDYVVKTILSGRSDALAIIINDKNKEYVSELVFKHSDWYKLKNKLKSKYIRKITKPIKNIDSTYIIGYVDIYFDLTNINNLIDGSNLKGRLLIADNSNDIILDSYREKSIWKLEKVEEEYLDKNNKVASIKQDVQTKYKYISVIKNEDLGIGSMIFKISLISLLCIALILIITYFVIKNFSDKLSNMMQGIENIKRGDLSVRFNVEKEEDELDMIAIEIDRMCESLQENIEKTYKSEVKQKEAELNALQAQIKPHFLYNTLEVIRMCALASKNKEVANMIYNLASMFKYSTYNNASDVKLSEMINYCQMYLNLCCTRYKGIIDYKVDIDEELLDFKVPKFILQPVIENSINHGMAKDRNDNFIFIKANIVEEDIELIVEDNGIGISSEKMSVIEENLNQNLQKKSSIGLMNINSRLKIRFGDKYGIYINSEENRGTIVKIKIPILKDGVKNV